MGCRPPLKPIGGGPGNLQCSRGGATTFGSICAWSAIHWGGRPATISPWFVLLKIKKD
jgi:hypothetical protein